MLAGVLLLAGCRRSPELPADLLELVPQNAALVMGADLQAMRKSPVGEMLSQAVAAAPAFKDLGSDPLRDTERLLFAAAGGPGHLEFLMLVRGRISREDVVKNARRRGIRLIEERRRGHVLYADPSRRGARLLFPAPGLQMIVSEGWIEATLHRLAGQGRALPAADPQLAAEARGLGTTRGAWLVSRLAPSSAQLVASRSGWAELSALVHVRGAVIAGAGLVLRLAGGLGEEKAALALEQRLKRMADTPTVRMLIGGPAKVARRGREVELEVNASAAVLQNLINGRPGGLTAAP